MIRILLSIPNYITSVPILLRLYHLYFVRTIYILYAPFVLYQYYLYYISTIYIYYDNLYHSTVFIIFSTSIVNKILLNNINPILWIVITHIIRYHSYVLHWMLSMVIIHINTFSFILFSSDHINVYQFYLSLQKYILYSQCQHTFLILYSNLIDI